jgi:hypothetical protein
VIQAYIARCCALDNAYQNSKYVVQRMMMDKPYPPHVRPDIVLPPGLVRAVEAVTARSDYFLLYIWWPKQ